MPISESQELVFRLLEHSNFNNLAGARVAEELRVNESLWRSAYFTSIGIAKNSLDEWVFNADRKDLMSLRDLQKGFLHLDTLLLLPNPNAQDQLTATTRAWKADIVQWIGIDEAARVMGGKRSVLEYATDPNRVLLYIWWD